MKRVLVAMALCAMPLLSMAQMSAKPMTLTGYISDSKCGASHNTKAPDANCVSKCIKSGAKPVFVDSKSQVWTIDNPDVVANAYGKEVTLTGNSDDAAKSLHIIRLDKTKALKGSSGMMD